MAQLRNGGKENSRHLNGGGIDESRCQLADPRVNGDHCGTNNIARNDDAGQTSEPLYVNNVSRPNHFLNGSATESELLQHISETISNFSLSPRPIAESFATTRLPAVAPKPSKSKKHQHQNQQRIRNQMGYQFHVNENKPNKHRSVAGAQGDAEDENRTLRFVGKRGLATGDGDDITSSTGTVRGVTNRVRAGITNFTYQPLNRAKKAVNNDDERDKIIVYTTSMRIVRQTFDDCQFVRKLFQNHRVRFEERDLFMNSKHQQELLDRLGNTHQVTLPVIFIDGELVGM